MSATSRNGAIICCLPASMETVPPVISNCPVSFTVNLPSSSCSMAVSWTAPTATDNCAVSSFTSSYSPGDIFFRGDTQVTYTASDPYGNTSTCAFVVTVKDITPPVITGCPANITVSADAGCKATAVWTPPAATDNCTVTMSGTHNSGQVFPLGLTKVTYTATDGAGNVSICTFNVTVEDKIKPVFAGCPSDIFTTANASCQAVVSWTAPSATDNCPVTLTPTHNPGTTFPFGETIVTYTATDQGGNVAVCSFKVVVGNGASPVITGCPKDITVNALKAGPVTVTWEEPQASVSCGELLVVRSHMPGSSFPAGTTPVTYVFTDVNGKSSVCDFNVIVLEKDDLFSVSKVLTPDGDGINDTWVILNIENYRNNTVLIVDRWGNKIFSATGYDNEKIFWNGMNKNGAMVPTGTYFYTVEVRHQDAVIQKKGFLELIQ